MNQLILFSFLTIASSVLHDTLAALVLDQSIKTASCVHNSPAMRPVVIYTNIAINKAKAVAAPYLKKEQNLEYNEALKKIHNTKNEWNVVSDIPKQPNTPTPINVLNNMNEQEELRKMYRNLDLLYQGLQERGHEAGDMNLLDNKVIFLGLMNALDDVRETFALALPTFKAKAPEKPWFNYLRESKDKKEHDFRNWVVIHDYVLLMEYTNEVSKHLLKKYCGITM